MPKKPAPYMIDNDNPEWTDAMFAEAKPARDVLPKSFFEGMETLKKSRGAQKNQPKNSFLCALILIF